MSTQLSSQVDVITQLTTPKGTDHKLKAHDAAHAAHEIDASLKDANNLITRYVNEYVLTPRVVRGYDKYLQTHVNARKSHDQNGVLVYLAKHVKDVKMRKKEESFFSAVSKYGDAIRQLLHNAKRDKQKLSIVKRSKVKLANGNKLVAFVRKYMFFVTHLNTDYHFIDRDFARYGEKHPDAAEKHVVRHKGFSRSNEHVPLTIVINRQDLLGIRQEQSNSVFDNALGASSLNNSSLDDNNNGIRDTGSDADEVKLLVHEKQAAGLSSSPDVKLGFIEPDVKHNELTVDPDYSKKIDEFIGKEKEEANSSEIDNLMNHPQDLIDNKSHNLSVSTKSIYEPSNNSSGPNGGNGDYLQQLLNIHNEPVALNVQSQASPAENSTLELIRQPHIESVHDHGYISVINADDQRNTRISRMSEFNNTPLGNESKQVVAAYNRMSEMSSQQVGTYLQAQTKQTQAYFQPIVAQTLDNMDQPIVTPKTGNNTYMPYYANGPSIELKRTPNTVRMINTPQASGQPQARRLLGSGGYWGRKADSAMQSLLNGKF